MSRPQVKICGLRRVADAEMALKLGVDLCGMIFYERSPRCATGGEVEELLKVVPTGKRVYVDVAPKPEALKYASGLGFDLFQLHFKPANTPTALVEKWSKIVTPERLSLAPKIVPGERFPTRLLPLANSFLLDGFAADKFGGTGRTSDWSLYKQLATRHPNTRWFLAGGLGPENIIKAIEATNPKWIDVNSGIESKSGEKDRKRMKELFQKLSATGKSRSE